MPGEVVRPVRAARSGWARAPSFRPVRSASSRIAASVVSARPRRDRPQLRLDIGDELAGLLGHQRRRLVVELQGPLGENEA